MNAFSSPLAELITQTLLHSIWQSAGVLIILVVLLRVIPSRRSHLRYGVAYGSMLLILFLSIYTFTDALSLAKPEMVAAKSAIHANEISVALLFTDTSTTLKEDVDQMIHAIAPYMVIIWISGTLIFLLRLSGGLWYLSRIKKHTIILDDELSHRLLALGKQLHIKRVVRLGESALVHAPLIIGYFKPILLIPVGFIAGLSTEQIEAIFVHELTHIKRHDYLLNLVQSIVEAIFFFNPFVWIISAKIRTEREHCCDDAVVMAGKNARSYALALARLEELRNTKPALALSLGGTKNELLHRIKRLMEKSVNDYSLGEKLTPLILLVIGLICASWITLNSSHPTTHHRFSDNNKTAADTVIKNKKEKTATYSRKKIITASPDGQPHEEVTEEYIGDEDLRPLLEDFNFDMAFDFPALHAVAMMSPPLEFFPPRAMFDTIPHRFKFKDVEKWEKFEKEFQEKFSEHFADFYAENQAQLKALMDEVQDNMQLEFNEDWAHQMEARAKRHEEKAQLHRHRLQQNEEVLKKHEAIRKQMEDKMLKWENERKEHFEELEAQMKVRHDRMKVFEEELQKELQKDGYLKEGEKIEHMHWHDDDIKINGNVIRKRDVKKYNALHEKHLGKED